MDSLVKETINWQNMLVIKDIIKQLVLLALKLLEIMSETEISFTYCNSNKTRRLIKPLEEFEHKVDEINSRINFGDVVSQITSHCTLNDDKIEYPLQMQIQKRNYCG